MLRQAPRGRAVYGRPELGSRPPGRAAVCHLWWIGDERNQPVNRERDHGTEKKAGSRSRSPLDFLKIRAIILAQERGKSTDDRAIPAPLFTGRGGSEALAERRDRSGAAKPGLSAEEKKPGKCDACHSIERKHGLPAKISLTFGIPVL